MAHARRIGAEELAQRLQAGEDALVLDVRTPEEYRGLHASGAVLLPLDEVTPESVGERLREAGRTSASGLYFICHSGRRAIEACDRVLAAFPAAAVVEGGTLAWAQSGLPVTHGDTP